MQAQVQSETLSAMSRRRILGIGAITGATALLAACGNITTATSGGSSSAVPSSTAAPVSSAAPSSTAAAASTPAAGGSASNNWLYLSILTGKMIGKSGWPMYVPADFTLPANSTVNVEIRCFDDGPADIPSGYETVRGTVGGNMTLIAQILGDLSSAKTQTVQSVDPKNVAHTLTIADTGLNIPIPPLSTVRFTLSTGASGKHGWQCMGACGTGQGGWGGPMSTAGYMTGTMAVV